MLPPPAGLLAEDRAWNDRQLARTHKEVSGEHRPQAGDPFQTYLRRNSIAIDRWEDEEDGADFCSIESVPLVREWVHT